MTGPSVELDARTHAVRGDLADARLAEQVFAPHYALPMDCVVARLADLYDQPGGTVVAQLQPGDLFELLELAGDRGWGIARPSGLVGYCARAALKIA